MIDIPGGQKPVWIAFPASIMKLPATHFSRGMIVWLTGIAVLSSAAAAELPLDQRGPMEKLALFPPEAEKDWPGEECVTAASKAHVKDAAYSLHWHVTVDYTAGEKKYPVGWPRFGRTFKAGPARDWSGWDYLHGWLYTETSRAALPRDAAGISLNAAGGHADYHRGLHELKKGAWTELLIPISQLTHAAAVERLQLHISESQYNHGDTLDVFVSDLALLRHAAPALPAFAPESAVMFADAAHLPVKAQVAGVRPDETCTLTCELRRGTEVVARLTTPAVRGELRLTLDLAGKKPAPGDYDVVATVTGSPRPVTARLRLVESPWR